MGRQSKALVNGEAHAEFVRVWQTSRSVQEAADRLGMSAPMTSSRAHALRKRGVELKMFRPSKTRIDVEALNRLAKELER